MPSHGSTGDRAGWRATRAGAKTGRTSVPLRGAKPAPSCPILPYTLRDFLRFSAGVWGFKSPFRTYAAAGTASLFWLELLTIVLDSNDRTVVRPLATQGAGRRPRTSNKTSSSASSGRVAGGGRPARARPA